MSVDIPTPAGHTGDTHALSAKLAKMSADIAALRIKKVVGGKAITGPDGTTIVVDRKPTATAGDSADCSVGYWG